jgi:hypothetical protein
MREGPLAPGRLGVGAVAAKAAVGADELAVKPVHLRTADLALLARRLQCFACLRLLCLLLVHLLKYTCTVRPGHRRP